MITITDIGDWDETKSYRQQDSDVLEYVSNYTEENEFDSEENELCGHNSDGPVYRWLKREWNTDKDIKIMKERVYAYKKTDAKAFQLLEQKITVESI